MRWCWWEKAYHKGRGSSHYVYKNNQPIHLPIHLGIRNLTYAEDLCITIQIKDCAQTEATPMSGLCFFTQWTNYTPNGLKQAWVSETISDTTRPIDEMTEHFLEPGATCLLLESCLSWGETRSCIFLHGTHEEGRRQELPEITLVWLSVT